MNELYPGSGRFRVQGNFVVDSHAQQQVDERICECTRPEYAHRIAQALSLMGQLEEIYTSDHDEMLRLALAALERTKSSSC